MGIRSLRLLVTIFALGLGPGAFGADEALALKVRRLARAGDAFEVHLIFEQTRSQSLTPTAALVPVKPVPGMAATLPATLPQAGAELGPPEVTRHAIKADLTCRVNVVDVNFRGETALLITVGKFVSLTDDKEMVPAGKVIGLQSDGLDVYLSVRGGGELSEEARTVLKHVHPLEYQLDEASYGSKVPRKAGETWAADAVSVAQIDSNVAFEVDAASVKGKVTLVGAEKAGAIPAARVTVDLAYGGKDRYRKSSGEMLERQDLKAQISTLLPVDAARPPLEMQIVSDTHAMGTQRMENQGKEEMFKLEIDTHTSEKQTIGAVAEGK